MEQNKLYTYDRLSAFVDNYKTFVDDTTAGANAPAGEQYKYFHFQYSPDAINSTSIGRFGASLFGNAWKPMNGLNGMDAWKMNLGKQMIPLIQNHNTQIINTKTSNGMRYKIKQFANLLSITDILTLNMDTFDVLAKIAYTEDESLPNMVSSTQCPSGYANYDGEDISSQATCITPFANLRNSIAEGFTNPTDAFNSVLTTFMVSTENPTDIISVEWTGYFINDDGGYNFQFSAGAACKYFVWIGNKSVCEFVSNNADITDQNSAAYKFIVTNNTPVSIRIQCIFLKNTTPVFTSTITRIIETTSSENIANSLCYSPLNPFILYAAFVSRNQQDFLNNAFECFSNATYDAGDLVANNNEDVSEFYKQFRQNLYDVLNLKYDYNESNRLSYGTIPAIKTQYTIRNKTNELPFAFAIYRLEADPRMGSTYQIQTTPNANSMYPAHKFSEDLTVGTLKYAGSFSEKPGYYPNNSQLLSQQASSQITDNTALECKEKCISEPDCSNYFTFTSNSANKCITTYTTPEFNRVIPSTAPLQVDPNSSSLFLRNYQLDIPETTNCGTTLRPTNVLSVSNINDYSKNFEYYAYKASGELTTPSQIGICGSPAYSQQVDTARKILFDRTDYTDDGKWKEGTQWKSAEGFSEKNTDAVLDTSDAIRTNLSNSNMYANKMELVDERSTALSSELIPLYKRTRTEMEGNPKYDYNGKSLLYFRNKAIPQLREKRIIDNNQQYVTSQLMLSLGTLTAATLVVFAIMLARD
jgi:hypothetical protein